MRLRLNFSTCVTLGFASLLFGACSGDDPDGGGDPAATGGFGAGTGTGTTGGAQGAGASPATGGSATVGATGGAVGAGVGGAQATGGVLAATGGSLTATGGALTATGGAMEGTGGMAMGTGGVAELAGGTTGTGGFTTTTGGVMSTGGVSGGGGETTGGTAGRGRTGGTGGMDAETGGMPGTGGTDAETGGMPGTGGMDAETGGMPGTGGEATGGEATGGETGTGGSTGTDEPFFSFFAASHEAMERLSGSIDGFGGDLRYGEADGLTGADKICTEIAAFVGGSPDTQWRAFLSVASGPDGGQVNAIDRVGSGPWHDVLLNLIASTTDDLLNERPLANGVENHDLPNEYGVPNHYPNNDGVAVDNHHFLTGTNASGQLSAVNETCSDWTSVVKNEDERPRTGYSWSTGGRVHWIYGQQEGGCAPGIEGMDGTLSGGSDVRTGTVGSGGGYGGIYCFGIRP